MRTSVPRYLVPVVLLLLAIPATSASAGDGYADVIDITFPVAGPNRFIDDYDQWRGGGTRRHRATDIMADYGQTVHAAVGGTITYLPGLDGNPPSWGYMMNVAGDDGRRYVYIHLGRQDGPPSEAYAPGLTEGSRVERAQHLGFVGHSGNASPTAPHLHFEIHDASIEDPYGTDRRNPYASLLAAQQRGDLPTSDIAATTCRGDAFPLVGDWDRSGSDGIGWWCDGQVRLRTPAGDIITYRYGRAGDLPIVADWNGDGRDTVSIIRDGTWHLNDRLAGGAASRTFIYGRVTRGDVPIAGDWNGDGRDGVGIIRDGQWHLRNSRSGGPGEIVFTYGRITRGDRALIGDWTASGNDRIGIVRDREWHLRHSLSGGPADHVYIYGRVTGGDIPVMGDWNGDGRATPGIVRGEEWHLRYVHAGGPADTVVRFTSP